MQSALASAESAMITVYFERYAGKWYEVARLSNRFQRKCASDTSAMYTQRDDGKITVVNECRTVDGRVTSVTGTAHVASKAGPNTKLKVTFFWPFYGDYWIIEWRRRTPIAGRTC